MSGSGIHAIRQSIQQCMIKDRYRLKSRLRRLKADDQVGLDALTGQLEASQDQVARRRRARPEITYDAVLPVVARREDIARAIQAHQVVVIAGETGSGKTTQLPKICLEAGLGIHGLIGHTQPRRLAARAVAGRLAEELNVPLGEQVGYQVRFTDNVSDNTLVKLMTDGILLAEIQNDRFLDRYDTLIIDEAHERSLNIDFLLGYIKLILPKRPELKVIITSATIDVERFSHHFDQAPVIEVSGRTYPVTLHYRPMDALALEGRDADQRLQQAIYGTLLEIIALERAGQGGRLGDVLVFLSGEREIRETARFLRKARLPHTEVLPLYARLSAAEQNRIFQPHAGRRVILSTNVAETSLTVPGIRYVIDPGSARISRYSVRSKVQRLPVEPVSQASANQRKGRCGRVADGICFRLYSEEDFLSRPEFTDAEILRTNLAAVILQMLRMGLGDIARFPFVDRPDNKAINDGFALLQELGAVDGRRRLTPVGRQLSTLPVDPRLARMLVAAQQNQSLRELIIITSALAVQDPRERPAEKQQAADQCHRALYHEDSDFLTLVNLWEAYEQQRQQLSQSQLRKYCKQQFLSFLRMREWRDLHRQLTLACRDLGFRVNDQPASYGDIHRALLAGQLSHLGSKDDEADYMGARNRRFYLFPGSTLYRRKPKWVMASELVETSRLFARVCAKIEPQWIEPLAGALVKRQYFEPHWEKKRAQVVAFEQLTLYGLVIVGRRRVHYGTIDPVLSREIFIREALVEGHYQSRGAFQAHNSALIAEIDALESKSRRRDIMVDSQTLYAFYDERIAQTIVNGAGFEHWREQVERSDPSCLLLTREALMRHDAGQVTAGRYPDRFCWEGLELALSYHFAPGEQDDGVTLTVPVQALRLLPAHRLEWLVPGMLFDKCVAMVRALPKALRRNFVPVPDFVRGALDAMAPADEPLAAQLGRQLTRMAGVPIPEEAWHSTPLEAHFLMNFNVVDEQGQSLGQGRDLAALRERFASQVNTSIDKLTPDSLEQQGLTGWPEEALPREVTRNCGGLTLKLYPALVDQGNTVAVRLLESASMAEQSYRQGVIRLLRLRLSSQLKFTLGKMAHLKETLLLASHLTTRRALEDDLQGFLIAQTFLADTPCPDSSEAFEALVAQGKGNLQPLAEQVDRLLNEIFRQAQGISRQLKARNIPFDQAASMADIKQHLGTLLADGFMQDAGLQQLNQFPRYLKAMALRLEKLPTQVNRDRALVQELAGLRQAHDSRLKAHQKQQLVDEQLTRYRWMLEEYRVSLFAQQLGTCAPVSDKRLRKLWLTVKEV